MKGPGEWDGLDLFWVRFGRSCVGADDPRSSAEEEEEDSSATRMMERPWVRSPSRSASRSRRRSLLERLMSSMSRTWTGMSWSRRVSLMRGFEREGGRA